MSLTYAKVSRKPQVFVRLTGVKIEEFEKIRDIETEEELFWQKETPYLAETYRNFQLKHNLRFNIIAGIVNLKHAF